MEMFILAKYQENRVIGSFFPSLSERKIAAPHFIELRVTDIHTHFIFRWQKVKQLVNLKVCAKKNPLHFNCAMDIDFLSEVLKENPWLDGSWENVALTLREGASMVQLADAMREQT